MIFWWIFDAASLHPSNMLENLHMLKHWPAQWFKGFPCSMLRRFFCLFPDFRCRTALKNRLGLWSDFPSVLPPKIDENDSKIHAKTAQKAFQNGCKIWMPLGIAFLSILYEFGRPGGDNFGLFFTKNGATLIDCFASGALGVEFSLPGSVLAPKASPKSPKWSPNWPNMPPNSRIFWPKND